MFFSSPPNFDDILAEVASLEEAARQSNLANGAYVLIEKVTS